MNTKRSRRKYLIALFSILLLALPATLKAADSRAKATTTVKKGGFPSYFPHFSWATVPRYEQFADANHLLTHAQAKQIASSSSFICVEKNMGVNVVGSADVGAKDTIAQLKALNPRMKALFYFNSFIAWPYDTNSKVFRYGGSIPGKYRSFLIKNPKTGKLESELKQHYRTRVYLFNVLNPAFRSWWADEVGKYVRETGADGVFVDRANTLYSGQLRSNRAEALQAKVDLLKLTRAAIGPRKIMLLNNAAGIPALFQLGDGFMMENYNASMLSKEAIVHEWALMKKIARARKFSVWVVGSAAFPGKDKKTLSKKEISYYLAAFLIGAQPYSYLKYGWGWDLDTGPLASYPDFKKPLGKPLGDYTRPNPNGWIFMRQFEHANVWVDLATHQGRIQWK